MAAAGVPPVEVEVEAAAAAEAVAVAVVVEVEVEVEAEAVVEAAGVEQRGPALAVPTFPALR